MNGKVYKKNYNKLTKEEVRSLDELKINSKFLSSTYNNVIPLKIYGIKGKWNLIFKCACHEYFSIDNSRLSYLSVNGGLENIHCGCIDENEDKIKLEEAKAIFHSKQPRSESNKHWCTYCESYRPEVKQRSKNTYNCSNCDFLISKAVTLGESFEEIMARWDPTTHKPCTKKLPYLEGNNKKGYKVRGFTYISSDWYDEVCKWLWIKAKDYIKTSFSKENLDRVGNLHLYKPVKDRKHNAMFLHRFILGLGNDVNMVGDHLSGYKLDNRKINLRYITIHQNSLNSKKKSKTSTSKYKGVSFYTKRFEEGNACWKAGVSIGNKHRVKYFYTEEEAAKAYDNMLREYLSDEIHKYNFPREGEMSAI